MAPGPFKVMRQNWKTSAVVLSSFSGALWYTFDYSITNDVMKNGCERAAMYGDKKLKNFNARTRHITVILNPVAGKRKSKKLYSNWVEPLLHLAGIKVSLIETESPNQAFDLMKIMSNCDGVAIVGGDGTVHEALNGLLSRPDCAKAAQDFPIAILPTGQFNSIARYIHQNLSYRNQKEFLVQSTMRLIDSCTEKHDVLKITPLDEELKNQELPVYALRDVRYGKYQSIFFKTSGFMFYQNNIKPYWLRFQSVLSGKFSPPRIAAISYTKPCEGCSRCYDKHRLMETQKQTVEEEKNVNRRWWSMFAPVAKPSQQGPSDEEKKETDLAKRDNPDCDRWLRVAGTSDLTDFRACMMGDKKVRLSLGLFGEYTPSEVLEAQDVRLRVAADLDKENKEAYLKKSEQKSEPQPDEDSQTKQESEESKEEEEDKVTKFIVDGQPTQAHSIEISTICKAVTIFTGPLKIIY